MYMEIIILKNWVFLKLFATSLLFFPLLGSLALRYLPHFHFQFTNRIESTGRRNALIEFYCSLRCFSNSFGLRSQKLRNNFEFEAKGSLILEQICLSSYDKWFDLSLACRDFYGSVSLFLASSIILSFFLPLLFFFHFFIYFFLRAIFLIF